MCAASRYFQNFECQKLIKTVGLLLTVVEVDTYVEEVVKEFYANLAKIEFCDCGQHCVYVLGTMYELCPHIINQLFQLPNPLMT